MYIVIRAGEILNIFITKIRNKLISNHRINIVYTLDFQLKINVFSFAFYF